MKSLRFLMAAVLAGMLAACGSVGGVLPSGSTVTDLAARLGPPTDIRFDGQGNEFWEYARGPQGTETYLYQMDRSGRVVSVTQLLTAERLGRIVRGETTKVEVRQLLGRPSDVRVLGNGTVWEWRVMFNANLGYFAVRFGADGIAEEAMQLPDIRDGGRGDRGK